ncbi:MAG: Rne/Rng family ribonuclease [Acidobacteriota bacterium]|nr:MAG: Rne/Rng family ribonuclease [Acidobacteriota bacterium]
MPDVPNANAEPEAASSAAGGPAAAGRAARTIVITRDLGEIWIALIERNRPVELILRPADSPRFLGRIVKGTVTRTVPGVSAHFVDIGIERDAFTMVRALPSDSNNARPYKPGDEVVVQIVREPERGKGPRASMEITLPGWALVLMPFSEHRGVSRRIADDGERERLREILERLEPRQYGIIARTAAAGATSDRLADEYVELLARWRAIEKRASELRAPAVLEEEPGPVLGFVRDHLASGVTEIVTDDEPAFTALSAALPRSIDGVVPALTRYGGPLPAVEAFRLDTALDEALGREVRLRGGGRLVIEQTEALVSIDVNSAQDIGAADLEQTALRTNLAAVTEIARQLRMRELGGLIVVDFIDLSNPSNRGAIERSLRRALADDRAKTHTLPLTEFFLAQITRQQRRAPLAHRVTEPCTLCGEGYRLRPRAEARRLLRELRRVARYSPKARFEVSAPANVRDAAGEILASWGCDSHMPDSEQIVWKPGDTAVRVVGQ